MTVSKITNAPTQKELIDKTNEIIDNLGGGGSSTDVQINGTSITSGGVANILTNTAYNASSNKIATMSDIPSDEIFVATYGTTTFSDILAAYNAGKTILCKYSTTNSYLHLVQFGTDSQQSIISFYFTDFIYTVETTVVCNITTGWSVATYNYPSSSVDVGNSTTPVYINNRVVTSTGLSIASSRFDGQWVFKYSSVATNTAINSYSHSLSSYLPSDSYSYEVFVKVSATTLSSSSGGSCNFVVGTSASPETNSNTCYNLFLRVTTNSTQARGVVILPVGTGRTIYSQISGHKLNSSSIELCGYRRIGTNS